MQEKEFEISRSFFVPPKLKDTLEGGFIELNHSSALLTVGI